MRRVKKTSKKLLVSGVIVLLVAGALSWWFIGRPASTSDTRTLTSKSGTLKLKDVKPGMVIKNGSPIKGSYKSSGGATIYYTVSSKDGHVLGAGNIAPSAGHNFSRNLALSSVKNYKGKKCTLLIYVQGKSGKRLDSVSLNVIFD